ncbi:MAG: hypothetical protein E2P01_11030 [Acidobacteria bacterium]|nr:MAG: hypothetical protein E2P01_11030 [Acidobacteriota bacterium]
MRKLTSREKFLLVVVVGLGVLGWMYGRDGGLAGVGVKAKELAELKYGAPPVVQLARLERTAVAYDSKARNLFSYFTPPRPARPPAPKVSPSKPVQRRSLPPPVAKSTVTRPAPEPRPPHPSFRYIGFLGPKDNKIAVLERGDEVLLAGIGEVIEEQYKVVDFKYEMLIIGYTAEKWADKTTELPMKR